MSGHVNRRRVQNALSKLPERIDDAYREVWDRIFGQHQAEGRHASVREDQDKDRQIIARVALTWITHAKERLTVDMLLRAIAISLEPDLERIEEDDLIDVELLLSSCAGLVIVNQEDGFIRLVHYTTQDYLEKQLPRIEANTSIARVCLTYFGLEGCSTFPVSGFRGPSYRLGPHAVPPVTVAPAPPPPPPRSADAGGITATPVPDLPLQFIYCRQLNRNEMLAGYAATYWGDHARAGREEDLEELILSTLRPQDMRDRIEPYELSFRYPNGSFPRKRLSLFHLVCRYGLSRICSRLLETGR